MPESSLSPGVIVVGMHRSSTSLVAAAFAACGYRLGADLLPPAPDNPKGYFEDRQVHNLHRRMLESYQTAWDLSPRLRELRDQELTIAPDLEAQAEAIVADYRSDGPWVWKNPRATLFMEEWGRLFPEATFVLCLRSPGEVVDSMLRRKDRMRIYGTRVVYRRMRRFMRALSLWKSYNLVAWRFAKRHPERVVVVRIPQDLPVISESAGDVFDPTLLRKGRALVRLPAVLAFPTRLLYWRLARRADPSRIQALLRSQAEADPARADAGHVALAPVFRIAASAALSTALDLAYNAAF